jgi:uncharacterized protein YdeI (YjbR/CyaY-like superfamily)
MNHETNPTFFATQSDFRQWLIRNHTVAKELYVGFRKVGSGLRSITWSQSVDEALCFGWIDGLRKSIDADSYFIRFTPRKPTSNWSAINIAKFEELTLQGLITPAGLAAYKHRTESKSKIYSYENEEVKLSPEFVEQFRSVPVAWNYFQSMPPSYSKVASRWVMSAKQPATRAKRLGELIRDSLAGRKIKQLSWNKK